MKGDRLASVINLDELRAGVELYSKSFPRAPRAAIVRTWLEVQRQRSFEQAIEVYESLGRYSAGGAA